MVYVMGVIGFFSGFAAGLMALSFFLRHKTGQQLVSDKSLRVYGLLNWLAAVLGAMAFMRLYVVYYG